MNALLITAIEAAIAGGEEILSIYKGDFDIEIKQDESPVTIADKNSNERIISMLETTGIPILSEESENLPYEERKSWQQFWLVDPLDGTKQFIKRNDEFTVNIALVDKNEGPVIGILYLPVTGKIYFSLDKKGAFVYDESRGKDVASIVKNASRLDKVEEEVVAIAVNRSSGNSPRMQEFINSVASRHHQQPSVLMAGSALKFGWLAEGMALYYPRFKPSMEWDTAAGHAIVKETGFTVVNADTGEELKYNKASLLNPSFIVCKPEYL